jgi:hypothetical protein
LAEDGAGLAGSVDEEVRKVFFSEEKNQKTFIPGRPRIDPGHGLDRGSGGEIKVFLLLFLQKKKTLP